MRPLIELIEAAGDTLEYSREAGGLAISSITADSRQAVPGSLFVALKGTRSDGAAYIPQAKENGAVAVLCDLATDTAGLPAVRTPSPRLAFARMAAALYGSQPDHMVAITGTDGKTSTADFFRQLWRLLGEKSASIGTLGIVSGDGDLVQAGSHTTPDPAELHRVLAELAKGGTRYAAMEASSHGLDQHRLDGVRLEAAAFTNIARDHLDYHPTQDAYFAAKMRLFVELLPEGKTAVLNHDDEKYPLLKEACRRRNHWLIGFGRSGGELKLERLELRPHGQKAQLELFGKPHTVDIPLVGAFQVMNILAALGLALACGGELARALAAVSQLKGVPGRLEHAVTLRGGASVFVDYAHTPLALANILRTLRPHTRGRLHVVFGCGGDRDPGKRPEMGKIAAQLADEVIVTDDNPRGEDPAAIRRAILAAAPGAKEVAQRGQAIYAALKALQAGDVLVIAGKGHEKTQIVGGKTLPFDDVEIAREAAKELKLA